MSMKHMASSRCGAAPLKPAVARTMTQADYQVFARTGENPTGGRLTRRHAITVTPDRNAH